MTPPVAPRSPARLGAGLEFVLILAWTFVLFGNLLPGGYLADDHFLLAQRLGPDGALDARGLWELFGAPQRGEGPAVVRPVWRSSYLLDLAFVQLGVGAAASRALGLGLHATCAWLLTRWLVALGVGRGPARLAGFLAVAWPTGVEAVVWVAARCDLLATAGLLAALALRADALARPERSRVGREVAVWALIVLALWSKETAAAGGALLLGQEFLHPARAGLAPAARLRAARGFLARGAALAALLALHRWALLGTLVGGYRGEAVEPAEVLLSVGFNLCSTLFPLAGYGPLPLAPGATRTVLALAACGSLLLVLRGRSGPALRLAVVWLWVSLAVLGGLRIDDPLGPNTRLLYQPGLAWLTLLCLGLGRLAARAGRADPAPPPARNLAQAGGVVLGVAALGLLRPGTADFAAAAAESARLEVALRAEVERALALPPGARGSLVCVGVEEWRGRAPLGLNAFPSLFEPPFVPPAPGLRAVGITAGVWREGRLPTRALLALVDPGRRVVAWDGRALAPVERWTFDGPRAEPLPLVLSGEGRERRLVLSGAEPGARVRLLVGPPGDGPDLGAVGRVGLDVRIQAPLGVVGSDGTLSVEPSQVSLPRNPEGAPAVQALVLGADSTRLSELRTLASGPR